MAVDPSTVPAWGPTSAGAARQFPGMVVPGNINLSARPIVHNADGSYSTVRSMSFQDDDGLETLVPTVSPSGRILSTRDAIALYQQTGQHLGKFMNPDAADAYAEQLHNAQAARYDAAARGSGGGGGDSAPAWGPMSSGASAPGTDASGFMLDDSAQQAAPVPAPPDVARYIPTATLEDAQRQQQANEWDQQARQKIADMWGQQSQATQNDAVQRWLTPPQYGPPAPTTYEPVQDPMSGAPMETPAQPSQPQDAGQPNVIQQLMDGLGGLVDKLQGPPAGTPPSPAERGAAIEAARPADAPALQTPDVEALTEQGVTAALQHGQDTRDAAFGHPNPDGTVTGASGKTYTKEQAVDALASLTSGAMSGDVVSGKLAAGAAQTLPDALVTAAKGMMGEDRFAAAQKLLDDDKMTAKFASSKNLDRDLKTQAQQDAYAIWRQAKNMESAPAAADALPGPEIFDEPSKMGAQPPPEPDVAAAAQPRLTPPPHTLDEPAPYTGAGDSVLAQHPVVQALNNVQSVLKQAVVGGSIFHPLVLNEQLARTALGAGEPMAGAKAAAAANRGFVDSGFAKSWMADNADTIARAEDAGATNMRIGSAVNADAATVSNQLARSAISAVGSGAAGFTSAKLSGQSNEDALKRAGLFAAGGVGVARVAPAINEALWGRFVPIAKTEAFKMLEPQYGADVAAKRVNDIFGGQNLAKLGRNPEFQTLARATFLAPDWMESWARNAGAALKPGAEGDAARRWWLATGVSTGLTLEGLNMALAGHPTWENEPGHQFQLETTDLLNGTGQNPGGRRTYLDVMGLGPLGSTLNAASKAGSTNPLDVAGAVAGRFAENHLNVVPGATLRSAQNFANGHQIVPEGTPPGQAALPEAGAAASSILPIPLSGFTNESISPAVSAVGGLTGLRPSEGSAYSPAVQQAFQKTGEAINPTPNTLALGSGAQVPIDAGMKHEYQNALGAFLADHVKEIDSPEAAAQLRQAGEKVAMAAVLDKHPELTGKAVSTKQVAVQKAEQKAGVAPGTFWKGASGPTPTPAANAPAVANPAAKQPASGTFWKAAA